MEERGDLDASLLFDDDDEDDDFDEDEDEDENQEKQEVTLTNCWNIEANFAKVIELIGSPKVDECGSGQLRWREVASLMLSVMGIFVTNATGALPEKTPELSQFNKAMIVKHNQLLEARKHY